MDKVTEANFINLANNMQGTGLITTGEANFQLAKDYAKQEAIAFAEFLSNYEKGIVPRNENGKVVWYFNDGESVYNGSTESVYELFQSTK